MNTVIILAAGNSNRAELGMAKMIYKVFGKPIFLYSIDEFLELGFEVILVINKNFEKEFLKYIDNRKLTITYGGNSRTESVYNGLKLVKTKDVFIHDGARPLINKSEIIELINRMKENEASALFEVVSDSVKKYVDQKLETVNRNELLLTQTPQVFKTKKIMSAYEKNFDKEFVDDIELYQTVYPNDKIDVLINRNPNFKITYKEDIDRMINTIDKNEIRIGHSYDIHQLVENRRLILGGIEIPFEKGLLGHSDADVVLHAISEALLGALALGDIGTHFPDTDQKNLDIDSKEILKYVCDIIKVQQYELINMDVMIFAEKPKLLKYINDIRESIAKIMNIEVDKISIKATTNEKMDSIGKGNAIASEAVVLVKRIGFSI